MRLARRDRATRRGAGSTAAGGLQGRSTAQRPEHPLCRHHPDRPPVTVYDWYVDRGEPERIKDLKRACAADRLSDHRFWANQFRLLLHAAAYWLLDTLRRWLARAAGRAPATGHAAAAAAQDRRRVRNCPIGSGCAWRAVIPGNPSGTSWPPITASMNNPG